MFEWDHRVSNGWNADTRCLGKAAHQQQGEGVVLPERRLLVGRFQRGDDLLPAAAGAHAAPLVDHGAAGGGDQPRPRVAGDALLGPVLRGGNQRLLDRVLAAREVLIAPHQHAEDPRSELPQQVLDASVSRQVLICSMTSSGGASMHWRTSMGASAAWLIRAAISTARASFSTSTTQNPTRDSRDPANGPSVATGTPCWTLTVLAWLGSASPCWNTSSPDSISSTSIRCMNSIISLIHSGDLPWSADVSPNVMIMYFISSLPISAPGTGALTSETEPRQHSGHGSPLGSYPQEERDETGPPGRRENPPMVGLHPSHASGIRDTLSDQQECWSAQRYCPSC